jgi:hypothetical protein
VYGKRNPNAVIEARQKRLYRRQLEGLPARQLVLDHADRESCSEKTAWSDWKTVQAWTDADFEQERSTLVSRLAGMRMRAINQALRKGQLQSAAQMMDALGRVVGESMPETLAIQAPDLKITIEDNKQQ